MQAAKLQTNHLTAPIGMGTGPLFLSWQCTDGMHRQNGVFFVWLFFLWPAFVFAPLYIYKFISYTLLYIEETEVLSLRNRGFFW